MHVVDAVSTRADGLFGDVPAEGVDGEKGVSDRVVGVCADRLYDGDDAPDFFLGRDEIGTGTGGVAANVDNMGARGNSSSCVGDGGRERVVLSAVGEGVGCHVECGHEMRFSGASLLFGGWVC